MMKTYLKKAFQLSDSGAKGLVKSIWSFFLYYVSFVPPMICVFLFADRLLHGNTGKPVVYLLFMLVATLVMYLVINYNYKTTYDETYQESANLRIDLAEQLSKLPLSGYDHISCRDGYSMDYRTHRSNQFALRQKAEPPFRSDYQRHYYLRYLCANFLAGIPSSTVLCDSSEMVQCLTKSRLEGLFTSFICPGGSQFVFTHPNYAFLSSG